MRHFGSSFTAVRSALILLAALLMLPQASFASCCASRPCCMTCPLSTTALQVHCCTAPAAPGRAVSRAQSTVRLDSAAALTAIAVLDAPSQPHIRTIAYGYSPPGRLASLAILCSRQI
ncbi:MAG: hypothetical protein ACREQI_10285 [Candidatus Binataceae bacterium]